MKFTVKFEAFADTAVNVLPRDIGLEGLELVRSRLGNDVPAGRVLGVSRSLATDPVVVIEESIARQLPHHFARSNSVVVRVPAGSLNKYVTYDVRARFNDSNGAVIEAWIEPRVDETALIADWIAAGAPTEWNPLGKQK